jgi:4-amino-4-deoxy-L-arabinose transferase-like glycosyltransferase
MATIIGIVFLLTILALSWYTSTQSWHTSSIISAYLFAIPTILSLSIYTYCIIGKIHEAEHNKVQITILYGIAWCVLIATSFSINIPSEISNWYLIVWLFYTLIFIINHTALSHDSIKNLSNAIDYFFSNEKLSKTGWKKRTFNYFCKNI